MTQATLIKSECELNIKILRKIQEIQKAYPELSAFLDEMRFDGEDTESKIEPINYSKLKAYYDLLDALLTSYHGHSQKQVIHVI